MSGPSSGNAALPHPADILIHPIYQRTRQEHRHDCPVNERSGGKSVGSVSVTSGTNWDKVLDSWMDHLYRQLQHLC